MVDFFHRHVSLQGCTTYSPNIIVPTVPFHGCGTHRQAAHRAIDKELKRPTGTRCQSPLKKTCVLGLNLPLISIAG